MPLINSPAELEEFRQKIIAQRDPKKPCITLCSGSACHATGSGEVAAALEEEIARQGLGDQVDVRRTGCHGYCERGPIIVIHPDEICYFQIDPKDVPEIVSETIKENKVVERLLYTDPETGGKDHPRIRDSLLQAPTAAGLRQQRQHRSQEHRRLPGHRRVLRLGQGSFRYEPPRGAR